MPPTPKTLGRSAKLMDAQRQGVSFSCRPTRTSGRILSKTGKIRLLPNLDTSSAADRASPGAYL
jgi:hypothetical protein